MNLRTAALKFCHDPAVVASVLHGASKAQHVRENVASMSTKVPSQFWAEAKRQGLIEENAPTPA